MKEKDAAVIKVLADIGVTDEPELTPKQEQQLERALDPEKQFLYDVEKLFNPQLQEDAWDDAESRRKTPNPLPVADSATLNKVFDRAEDLDEQILAHYKKQGKSPNGLSEIGALLKQGRREFGRVENVPMYKVLASENMLDGQHLEALTNSQQTTEPSGDVVLLKFKNKYYVQDGNHRIAAAVARRDKLFSALVLNLDNI